MKIRILILYSWFVRTFFYFFPDVPIFQRTRGYFYSLGMSQCGKSFRVSHNAILNHLEKLQIGNNVYLACGVVVTGGGNLSIGNDVLVGPNVVISTNNHKYNGVNFLSGYTSGSIVIEDGCWIGGNVSLLAGTHIRKSSVVGAGSVCNDDYHEPHVLIGGNLARIIKHLNKNSL